VLCLAGRFVTVVALCSAIGLHWIALQSVAWTAMMIQNAKQTSFCQAVQRTFDGGHPCSLCHLVNKGNASGQKQDAQTVTPKIDIICVARTIRLLRIFAFFEYAPGDFSFLNCGESPPVPPPRMLV